MAILNSRRPNPIQLQLELAYPQQYGTRLEELKQTHRVELRKLHAQIDYQKVKPHSLSRWCQSAKPHRDSVWSLVSSRTELKCRDIHHFITPLCDSEFTLCSLHCQERRLPAIGDRIGLTICLDCSMCSTCREKRKIQCWQLLLQVLSLMNWKAYFWYDPNMKGKVGMQQH